MGGSGDAEVVKARPRASYGTGGDHRRESTDAMFDDNEYGDEAFESEDLSPSRRSIGNELKNLGKCQEDSSKDAALLALETTSEADMQVRSTAAPEPCAHSAQSTCT